MILLADEELLKIRSTWLTTDCPDGETATKIALERLRSMNKAQIKKVLREAKVKDISNTFRLALLEEVK